MFNRNIWCHRMTHIDVPAVSGIILEEVSELLSERDLKYQEQHPESGVVVYHLVFRFLIMYYVKGQGAVWDVVSVEVTTTRIDAWAVFQEAEAYVMETYEPIEIYFLGVEVIDAYVVNVPHKTISRLPERYWYDWESALQGEIPEVDLGDLVWE